MGNIADLIERFILSRLSGQSDNYVLLQRNELADELACAPSQISYVLNTRFTVERGFLVESRRGSGGYIRVIRVLPHTASYEEQGERRGKTPVVADNLEDIIARLYQQQRLTRREAALMQKFFAIMKDRMEMPEQFEVLQSLLLTLAHYS